MSSAEATQLATQHKTGATDALVGFVRELGYEDLSEEVRHFAGKPHHAIGNPFKHVDGVPVLADASACIVAEATANHDCGDHTLFVGLIEAMSADDRPPLLYHAGRYGAFAPL